MKMITFESEAGDFTIFAEVAVELLKLMGHSGTVPGAILAADIPDALERLKRGLETSGGLPAPQPATQARGDPEEKPVSLRLRAYPLVQLLTKAVKLKADVLWDYRGKALGDYL